MYVKNDRMISVCFQDKPFNIIVIQVYAPTTNTEEVEVEWFYEDLQDILELTHTHKKKKRKGKKKRKKGPFYHRGLECKSRKSINTCCNRQIWS